MKKDSKGHFFIAISVFIWKDMTQQAKSIRTFEVFKHAGPILEFIVKRIFRQSWNWN